MDRHRTDDYELYVHTVETRSACLRVYASTPVNIPVHTPYINAYVIQNKLVLSVLS